MHVYMSRLPVDFTEGAFTSRGRFKTILSGQPEFGIAMQTKPDNVNVQDYLQGTKVDGFSRQLIMPLPYQLVLARPLSIIIARREEQNQAYPYTILIDSKPERPMVSKRMEDVKAIDEGLSVSLNWNHAKPDTLHIGIPLAVAARPLQLFQLSFNRNPTIGLVETGAVLVRNQQMSDVMGNTYLTNIERIFCPVQGTVNGIKPVPYNGPSPKVINLAARRAERSHDTHGK